MKRISILAVGLVAVLGVGAALLSDRSAPTRQPAAATPAGDLQTKVFRVDQMTCSTCPITVKAAIAAVKGVTTVVVNFDAKTATVTFDPTVATVEQIAAASTNAGYPATPAS